MAKAAKWKQPGFGSAAVDLETELADIAALNIDQLRGRWQQERGSAPAAALTKDLLARALSHWRQEEVLGGLDPRIRKVPNASSGQNANTRVRHVKIGSIIVREHLGQLHEVLVVPDGFCWQGQTYASLSTIAKKITGTSWNGPRFFGLRGAGELKASADVNGGSKSVPGAQRSPTTSVKLKMPARRARGAS